MVKLPPFQVAVLSHLFEMAPIAGAANTLEFHFSNEFEGTFHAAYAALAPKTGFEPCNLVTTLATHSDVVFFAVTGSSEAEVARALGSLEDYDRETRSLSVGQVVRIPDAHFSSQGLHAVVLLRPTVIPGFDQFGDCYTINSRHLRFVFALFLTEEEYLFRKSDGHDALMDRFIDEQRTIVVFEPC
jgi:hypothetical protein